jgi:hypothetical protein
VQDLLLAATDSTGTKKVSDKYSTADFGVTSVSIPGGIEYLITFQGKLGDTSVNQVAADGSKLTNNTPIFSSGDLTILQSSTTGNASLADLAGQVQDAINKALNAKGFGLGFLHTGTGTTTNTPISNGTAFNASTAVDAAGNPDGKYATTLPSDIPLSIDIPHQVQVSDLVSGDHAVQTVKVFGTGGTFALSYSGHNTADIAFGATNTTVQSALDAAMAAAGVSQPNVSVSKSGNVYTITFLTPASNSVVLGEDASKLTGDTVFKTTLHQKDVGLNPSTSATTVQQGNSVTKINAVQSFTVLNAGGGTFSLTYNGTPATGIAYNASAADVKAALATAVGGAGNISVVATPVSGGTTFTISFQGALAHTVVSQITIDGSLLTKSTVPSALQAVLNLALKDTGVTMAVVDNGSGYLKITPNGAGLNIDWGDGQSNVHGGSVDPTNGVTAPIMVSASGGRVSLRVPTVTSQVDPLTPPVTVQGVVQTLIKNYTDPAYQEMGLLSTPTRFDGVVNNAISLDLVVDGTPYHVSLASGSYGSIGGIVAALQAALPGAIAGKVTVQTVSPNGGGNAIEFVGKSSVGSLSINVPSILVAGLETNGAVTDLGFTASSGAPQKSTAGGAFIKGVKLEGQLTVLAPTITATASLGFIGVSATGSASLAADAKFALVNPLDSTQATPDTTVPLSTLVKALASGMLRFDAANAGNLVTGIPSTGPVMGTIGGAAGLELAVTGTGAIAGISGLNATAAIGLDIPDFLTAAPQVVNYYDPIGFGHNVITFPDATPVVLSLAAPSNGQLTQDLFLIINDGGTEAIATLRASDTAHDNSLADLQGKLQSAINAALEQLSLADSTIVVGVGSGQDAGKLTLQSSNSSLSVHGNTFLLDIKGPNLSFFDQFKEGFTFDNVIKGLQLIVNFLNSLTADPASGGVGGAVHDVLDTKLPLINKSVTDLINMAATFTNLLNQLTNNPASSIQTLESLLENALGLNAGSNILSYDPGNGTDGAALKLSFDQATGYHNSLPFNLDLSQISGLPGFIKSLVGVSASGDLGISLSADLHLALGIGVGKEDRGNVFLYTGTGGTRHRVRHRQQSQLQRIAGAVQPLRDQWNGQLERQHRARAQRRDDRSPSQYPRRRQLDAAQDHGSQHWQSVQRERPCRPAALYRQSERADLDRQSERLPVQYREPRPVHFRSGRWQEHHERLHLSAAQPRPVPEPAWFVRPSGQSVRGGRWARQRPEDPSGRGQR